MDEMMHVWCMNDYDRGVVDLSNDYDVDAYA